jgi:hypothetical protein
MIAGRSTGRRPVSSMSAASVPADVRLSIRLGFVAFVSAPGA